MFTAEQIINEKNTGIISIDCKSTIAEALKVMKDKKIGAVVATDKGKIVGIWTERDLVLNLTDDSFDLGSSLVEDFMSTDLVTAPHDFSVYKLLDIFLGRRLRHLFIKKDGEIIGLLSQGDVTKASLNEKNKELDQLNKAYKWDYYEMWKFNRNQ